MSVRGEDRVVVVVLVTPINMLYIFYILYFNYYGYLSAVLLRRMACFILFSFLVNCEDCSNHTSITVSSTTIWWILLDALLECFFKLLMSSTSIWWRQSCQCQANVLFLVLMKFDISFCISLRTLSCTSITPYFRWIMLLLGQHQSVKRPFCGRTISEKHLK